MGVTVVGLDRVYHHLDSNCSAAEMIPRMNKACNLVLREAVQKAPDRTGMLRRSIATRVYTEGGDVIGEVYSPLEYAIYVEYGTGQYAEGGNGRKTPWVYMGDDGNFYTTSGQHPQPFLRPALTENKAAIKEILGNA